jgi:Flp pilus assembly pilin Flp
MVTWTKPPTPEGGTLATKGPETMFAYSFALLERARAELALLTGDCKGVTALEYGVIAAGIVVVVGAAAATLGGKIVTLFGTLGNSL